MTLAELLYTQGFGSRRECATLVARGALRIGADAHDDPGETIDVAGLVFRVDGREWSYRPVAIVVLHKPAGCECSHRPGRHPSVYALLPEPLVRRGVEAIGRLDADTTGALVFTDDGALLHRLASPRHHVAKVYEVTCKHPVDAAQIERLRAGIVLRDEAAPVAAAACEATGERTLRMTLTEGKYHQVKRMVAAAGNRVEALHRSAFGAVTVEGLEPGAWRWVDPRELVS